MANFVFILGAGASADSGAPLMGNFIAKGKAVYDSGELSANDKSDFDLFFKIRNKLQYTFVKSNIDLDNIESIYSAIEFGLLIDRIADLSDSELYKSSNSIKTFISRTIEHSVKLPLNTNAEIIPDYTYTKFCSLLLDLKEQGHSICVITFNYDLGIDYAFTHLDAHINYGTRILSDPDNTDIPLLKLHGSLNWTQDTDQIKISSCIKNAKHSLSVLRDKGYQFSGSPYQSPSGIFKPADKNAGFPCPTSILTDQTNDLTPFIVPPTWNKGAYHSAISMAWRNAARFLRDAEVVYAIGYSAPPSDMFFKYLYALGTISDTIIDDFSVFCPSAQQNYKNIVGSALNQRNSFCYYNQKFTDAIETIKQKYCPSFDNTLLSEIYSNLLYTHESS